MKKVLFVATVVKLHIMVFHLPYLKWFKENGYEVHVCAKNDYKNNEECNIPFCDRYYDLPFERSPFKKKNINVQEELKKIIDLNEYEIIHCHTPMGGMIGRLSSRQARKKGTKVIYTAHGFHFYKGAPLLNWLSYYPVERWLARYTDVLITINTEDFSRAKKFKANRIEYVPGIGIDIDKLNEKKINAILKRNEINIPKEAYLLLSVGELNNNKNHEVIIHAIANLKNKQIHYAICGQGYLEDHLRDLSIELGLENQIHLLGFRNDVSEICKASNLFIFPSYREGLSVSLMESMANGMPVVCSNIRGNSDLIEEGKGGYLLEPNDINGFSHAINNIYTNKEKSIIFGKNNFKKIEEYSFENVIKKMRTIYEQK